MSLKNVRSPTHRGDGGGARGNNQLRQAIYSPHNIPKVRPQYLAARLHALGPRLACELLREITAGANLFDRLERYATLDPDIVCALGGDVLPIDRLPTAIYGGRR
jgi:hypothetical protein